MGDRLAANEDGSGGKRNQKVSKLLRDANSHLNNSISQRGTTKKHVDRALKKSGRKRSGQ